MVDGGDQVAQLVHGIVDRVGNGAGEVFGHRYGHGQVAVSQLFDFVEQAHDRLLVAFVLFRRLTQLAVGGAYHDQADEDDRSQRQKAQDIAADGVERGGNHAAMQAAVQVMADQFRAHGEFELWRLRVERGHLETEHFVKAQLVFENVAQHGVETGLLLGGAAGQGGTLNHGLWFLAQKKGDGVGRRPNRTLKQLSVTQRSLLLARRRNVRASAMGDFGSHADGFAQGRVRVDGLANVD